MFNKNDCAIVLGGDLVDDGNITHFFLLVHHVTLYRLAAFPCSELADKILLRWAERKISIDYASSKAERH